MFRSPALSVPGIVHDTPDHVDHPMSSLAALEGLCPVSPAVLVPGL